MKFYFISKSDYSKYEAPESSDRGTAAAQASVATKKTAGQSANDSVKIYFKEKRELDRRVRQAVHRYLKRALIQLEN